MLGEQAILNQEIYSIGTDQAQDGLVFGYQERWAEYRYNPSEITGMMRSTHATPIDHGIWRSVSRLCLLSILRLFRIRLRFLVLLLLVLVLMVSSY